MNGKREKLKKKKNWKNSMKSIIKLFTLRWPLNGKTPILTPVIDAVDETPFYFGSVNPAPAAVATSINNIKGFRKLIYHDVYPGVDVEFTFHPGTGIKICHTCKTRHRCFI